jgi:hypothetical protein
MSEKSGVYSTYSIEGLILILRGQKVILDSDLARIYGVPTKRLNEQVHRNKTRFPDDFMFRLSERESDFVRSEFASSNRSVVMRSQIATASKRNVRHQPYAFTEHGAMMAANVLNSRQAVKMSVFVVRAFVRLRDALAMHKELARKLEVLEKKVGSHDAQIQQVFDALRKLIQAPEKPKRRIGFTAEEKKMVYR